MRKTDTQPTTDRDLDRRTFLAAGTAAATTVAASGFATADQPDSIANPTKYQFAGKDALYYGDRLESLNPGYWKIEDGSLRRRLSNYGDRARSTGFPFHAVSHGFEYQTQYDPSLPTAIAYLRQWKLAGDYEVQIDFTYHGDRPEAPPADDAKWQMYQDGFGLMGLAIGSKSLYESYGLINNATQIGWTDDQKLRLITASESRQARQNSGGNRDQSKIAIQTSRISVGQKCSLIIKVSAKNERQSQVLARWRNGDESRELTWTTKRSDTEGYVGLAARGLIDFSVDRIEVLPGRNTPLNVGHAKCATCYPLGDTLRQEDGVWRVKFVAMFASDGEVAEIRVSDAVEPPRGWSFIQPSGAADIVNNDYRRHTSIIEVALPYDPADRTMYYTVWKDGLDVTSDPRIGTDACGAGSGLVGDVPTPEMGGGNYVGRLPQLKAPYKLCGLSCHAINRGLQVRQDGGFEMVGARDDWQIRDQPSVECYRHLDEYDFQIMVWEDDVWYMELLLYPPSTDDAYKIIQLSICGPTSRWQMMRHWNVINPGDHDYGMDDIKGPEQLILRNHDDLGQDASYLRRNFQIVHHLTTGESLDDPRGNPKKWRAWKMPAGDFTFLILDSRLWRSSQDVDIWDDAGWGSKQSLYDRTDPTRSLLGEEQFGWLQQWLATDTSKLIGVTGISGMHTVWTGAQASQADEMKFNQRDRVVADYAGWVKAGADRVLELFGSRDGIVTVYGDVHNGCIMMNKEQNVIECSFGPIGRSGGRGCIPGFAPEMTDVDGRELSVTALYHKQFSNPRLEGHQDSEPFYWNFLEMTFDPDSATDNIRLAIRNLVDSPDQPPRGGKALVRSTSMTGREVTSGLPSISTIANADVRLMTAEGKPIRGTRSDHQGNVNLVGLVDIEVGETILMTAYDGTKTDAQSIQTQTIESPIDA